MVAKVIKGGKKKSVKKKATANTRKPRTTPAPTAPLAASGNLS